MPKAVFKTISLDLILSLTHPELKVLHALTHYAKHNYLNVTDELLDEIGIKLGYKPESVQKVLPGLVSKKVMVKVATSRIYILDPSVVLVGKEKNAYAYFDNSSSLGLVAKKRRQINAASRKDWEEKRVKSKIEKARRNEDPVIYQEAKAAFGDSD